MLFLMDFFIFSYCSLFFFRFFICLYLTVSTPNLRNIFIFLYKLSSLMFSPMKKVFFPLSEVSALLCITYCTLYVFSNSQLDILINNSICKAFFTKWPDIINNFISSHWNYLNDWLCSDGEPSAALGMESSPVILSDQHDGDPDAVKPHPSQESHPLVHGKCSKLLVSIIGLYAL